MSHRAKAVERQILRTGAPVTVRRKAGLLDPVTSTRSSSVDLQVQTVGVFRRRTQRSAKGDPLSTEETFFVVPVAPFREMFTPQDGDLVMDGHAESRILSVRTRVFAGEPVAYELFVSGVVVA